jgi:dihydroorotate dehydrogenase electron transfer subunit
MIQETGRVIRLEQLSVDTWRLFLTAPGVAADVQAGQFVMLGLAAGYDPLLRRPFSVHFAEDGELVAYFRVVGKGTEMLATVRPGDELPLLGPLGKGFTLTPAPAFVIGGGIGTAPLLLLAKQLADSGNRAAAIVLAGRTAPEIAPLADFFRPWTDNLGFATDDGSLGLKGRADAALSSLNPAAGSVVYACGPQPMLKAIADFCRKKQIKCQVSVESAMACGMGACLGCARPAVSGGYVHVCLDGPVFDAEALPWG